MNSFLKGFLSIFNLFPTSKSYDDIREEVDEILGHDGWVEYTNSTRSISCDEWNNSIKKVTQSEFLDEMIKLVPKDKFVPYSYYNQDLDRVSIYFKDEDYYVQTVNEDMEFHISFETKEVVGLNFLNIKQLIKKYEHKSK